MILGCLGVILIAIGLGAFEAWIFMLLWNWIAPVFWHTAPQLNFWVAWGVCALLSVIGSYFRTIRNQE